MRQVREPAERSWLGRFAVKGIFWRHYLDWAVVNLPFYFYPIPLTFFTIFFFFFADGDELASGVSDDVGVALDFFFDAGEPDFSGDAVGVGVGDFSAVAFFLVFLCGVGVGASMLFSFVPNDCAAGARSGKADPIARHTSTVIPSKVEGPRETLRFAPDDTQFAVELLRQLCQHRFV